MLPALTPVAVGNIQWSSPYEYSNSTSLFPVNLEELMPVEMQMAYDLRDKGIMEHLMVKDGLKGAYILYNLSDKKEVEALIKKFPLYSHFERIEMTLVEQSF